MTYLEPQFNKKGQPICEICAVAYDKLLLHVNKRHCLTAKEYKVKYGFSPRKGIQSVKLQKAMRKAALANYDEVIMKNLIIGGISSRFKDGNTATDIERVRETTKERMNAYWEGKRETKEEKLVALISKLKFLK